MCPCPSTASCTTDKLQGIPVTDATKHPLMPLCTILVTNEIQQHVIKATGLQHDNQDILTILWIKGWVTG